MTLLDGPGEGPDFTDLAELRRVNLPGGAWVDVLPAWSRHSDELFEHLTEVVPWRAYERMLYGRTVPVPRLIKNYDEGEPLPDPRLAEGMDLLNAHYSSGGTTIAAQFTRAGLNLYRDGDDSVDWHSDTAAAADESDTMVAILSLGAPRTLSVRPRGGRASQRFALGDGDLLVMGGSFQRTHEHAVRKTARPVGRRISIQYRPTWDADARDRARFVERGRNAMDSGDGAEAGKKSSPLASSSSLERRDTTR